MKRKKEFLALIVLTLGIMFFLSQVPGAETYLEPLQGWRILIDPGTGGDLIQGPFIEETKKGLGNLEADVNMKIALFLSDSLTKAGAEVEISRESTDLDLPTIDDRIKKAADFNANLIISINHDYNKDPKANYVKVYYYPPDKEPDKSVALHIAESLKNELNLPSQGAEVYAFPFLARSKAPSVMISCGCISNPKYKKSLKDFSFNLSQARGILKGMMNFQEELSIIKTSQPPMTITEKRSPLAAPPTTAFSMPVPEVPASPPPVPKPIQVVTTPVPIPIRKVSAPVTVVKTMSESSKPFKPPFHNPLGVPFDQSWLFGETWGSLPVRKGNSFVAPEGAGVKAAEDGVVIEAFTAPGPTGIQYPNCVIIEHKNIIPDVPVVYTIYGQLAEMRAKKGDRVKQGDVIGITGAPSSATDSSRETEIVFEIRMGDLNEERVVNPEIFTQHTSDDTGIIVGQLVNKNGQLLSGVRIDGAMKSPEIERYAYSLTYAMGISPSKQYNENFVIGDVPKGDYYLSCEYGTKKVKVEKNKISYVIWQVE